jgi:hypothetical protein
MGPWQPPRACMEGLPLLHPLRPGNGNVDSEVGNTFGNGNSWLANSTPACKSRNAAWNIRLDW